MSSTIKYGARGRGRRLAATGYPVAGVGASLGNADQFGTRSPTGRG